MRIRHKVTPTSSPSPESPDVRDERLLLGIRAGDEAALEEMFYSFYDQLYHYAYRYVRSREVAEELIQDVFLRVWERRVELHGGERLRPYLFTAVRNAGLSWLRHAHVERVLYDSLADSTHASDGRVSAAPQCASSVPGMSESAYRDADLCRHAEGRELAEELRQAVAKLPTRARQAITLRWQRQLRNAEIADVLGCSVKAVEFSIARALDALRRILDPP